MQNPFQHINDVLNYSGKEAYRMLGNQVNTEHLMLGILHCNNKQVNDIFEHFGINTDVLRSTLYDSQEQAIDKISAEEIAETEEGRALKYDKETSEVISEAIIEARLCEGKAALVQPEHLLLAILKKDECDPAKLLITQGLTYKKLFDYINGINLDIDNKLNKLNQEVENYKRNQIDGDSEQEAVDEKPETETAPEQEQESAEGDINMIDLRDKQQLPENQEEADTSTLPDGAASTQDNQGDLLDPEEEPLDFSENQNSDSGKQGGNNGKNARNVVGAKPTKSNTPYLDKFSYDLTKAAKDGSLDPVVGRDKEMNRLIELDMPVTYEFVDRDHIPANVKLDRLPDDASETLRLVRIGDYDVCPCIGKHVRSTAQIGKFVLLGTNWDEHAHSLRIRFKIVQ